MSVIVLRVRSTPVDPWLQNFILGGWRVRDYGNSNWIQMTQSNTRVRNSDNTGWLVPR